GYISPEYALNGIFSVKPDIFSFGVLVLEIVSGKKNRGYVADDHHDSLLGHRAEDRPNTLSVVSMLGGEGLLPSPKQPGFFIQGGDDENATNPPPVPPTPQAPHTLSTIKLPILKKGDDENVTNPPPVPPTPQAPHTLSTIKLSILKKEGLHKGYDRFQSLLSQLEIHGKGVSTEDANKKFLRVFESDVKGSIASTSCTQNVAFVSSDSTNNTNEVSTAYGDLLLLAITHKRKALHHTMMISCTLSLLINPVVHNWIVRIVNRSKGNTGYKERDNGKRPTKQDEHKVMVTIDTEGVDWTGHAEDDIENYALMAFNSSNLSSDTKVKNKREKDKIGTKPDQIKKKQEAWKIPKVSKTNHSQNIRI
nr:putative S-locus glycoprotein domain-containing protein [Tanacetum cinerariifolium]